jgi:hypothetical protein
VINVNSQVLNYHSFIINTIFVSDPRVSHALSARYLIISIMVAHAI